jgi:M6 family metalloprotease-like protein
MLARRWLPVALALLAGRFDLSAQDVEMLGRRYGTRPPDGYFRELERNPGAYRFTRGRAARDRQLEALAIGEPGMVGSTSARGPARALGPRGQPVVGTFVVPVVLGLFGDSPGPPAYDHGDVRSAFFDAASGTVTELYDEMSRGRLSLHGDVRPWVQVSMTSAAVTQGQSALVCCGIGSYIKQILNLQTGVDWGLYDNDGPDGIPNSPDDDGYVDALAVIHPTRGAECGGSGSGNRIWSHKWTLSDGSGSGAYTTSTPRSGGGFVLIEDYFVLGIISCDGTSLSEIGTFAHETGHAFGLPDLYDTRASGARHNGAGYWDLMASGTWGCSGSTSDRPCHMGAWSKAMLGWVDVMPLPADADLGTLTLPPVETSGSVYRVDAADGSGEYFLLENRQRIGYDQGLFHEGMLVWQVDQNALATRWPDNEVNAFAHMAVWLRQADGCDDLGRVGSPPVGCDAGGLRGDAGDPFPGQTGNATFHAASNPASVAFPGTATGLTLLDIVSAGDDVTFHALTRFTRLTVRPSGTTGTGLFAVDGAVLGGPPPHVVLSAPFADRTLEAAAGAVVQAGERRPFVQWIDAPSAPRVRIVMTPLADAEYEAAYGGLQYQLSIPLSGGINGVAPGTISTTPASADLWFAPSTPVSVSAAAKAGFTFLGWSGVLAGHPNPTSVVMDAPVFAGADFQLTYAVADVSLTFPAAVAQDFQLVATNGTGPFFWSLAAGALPPGMALSTVGRLTGAARAAGMFPVTVQALDSIGLTAEASVDLDVVEPTISIELLTSRFLLDGPELDSLLAAYVDFQGNRNDTFDLGDFRAWVLGHPSLPLSVEVPPSRQPTVVLVPGRPAAAPAQGPRARGR